MPTLLIIYDDYFIPLDEFNAALALYCPAVGQHKEGYLAENGYFLDHRYERLGGVGVFNVALPAEGIRYSYTLYENSNASNVARLLHSCFKGYPRFNETNIPK